MKKITLTLVVAALIGLAPVAMAQVGPLSLGGMIGLDQKRLEVAPSVSFGLAVYNCPPPSTGFKGTGLIGLFSSSLGQYPVVNEGLWLKAQVDPFGINTLKGISRAKCFNPQLNKNEDWEPLTQEPDGTYTDVRHLQKVGVVPWVYRLEHRDGRDKYQFLFITATWTRGGNLPAKLETMVRPEIDGCAAMQPTDILKYLNGFVPAYGPLVKEPTSQTMNVPGQTATANTGNVGQGAGNPVVSPPNNGQFPVIGPNGGGNNANTGGQNPLISAFGVTVTAGQSTTGLNDRSAAAMKCGYAITEPSPKTSYDTSTTLTVEDRLSTVVRFESDRPFTVIINHPALSTEVPGKVERTASGGYVCNVYGSTINFVSKKITIVVSQDGQTRTIKFEGATR